MTEATPFHVGLTPERIVDAALELTQESHLYGWSIRDLARRLGVAPSVVYHHVGGKDLIARHVVEQALAALHSPDPDLDWAAWYRRLLHDVYPIAIAHPGLAKWMMMHGPVLPSVLEIIDDGIAVLRRAGFDERVGTVYSMLLNAAMMTIAMGDERLLHEDDGPRDHATMMAEFTRIAHDRPGLEALGTSFLQQFAHGGVGAAAQRRAYYDFVIETTIAGLSAPLPRPA